MRKQFINIGEQIKLIRENLGLKQKEFADKLNELGCHVTHSVVSRYENNEMEPNLKTLYAICILGNTSPNQVFGYKEEKVIPKRAISSIDTASKIRKHRKSLIFVNHKKLPQYALCSKK